MKLEDVHPTMVEALAIHDFARAIGYSQDDIFLHVLTDERKVAVRLHHDGKHAEILAGPWIEDAIRTAAEWTRAVTWWNKHASHHDRHELFEASKVRRGAVHVLAALQAGGMRITRARDVAKAG